MQGYRVAFFQSLGELSHKKSINAYFIKNYELESCELDFSLIPPRVKTSAELLRLFNEIDAGEIQRIMSPRYRDAWNDAYKKARTAFETNQSIKLNLAAQTIFGPRFNPQRESQSYNVYTSFYLALDEIAEIIDPQKIGRYEKLVLENKNNLRSRVFYTLDDAAKSLRLEKQDGTTTQVSIGQQTEVRTEQQMDSLQITALILENFVNLAKTKLEFAPGVNLFIGRNGTGKTNVLKLVYAIVRALEDFGKQRRLYGHSYEQVLRQKLLEIFQSPKHKLGGIVSKGLADTRLNVELKLNYMGEENLGFSIGQGIGEKIKIDNKPSVVLEEESHGSFNTIFVPAKEILGIHETIRQAYRDYIPGFDGTYKDLSELIFPFIEQEGLEPALLNFINKIESSLLEGGKIDYDSGQRDFLFKDGQEQIFEMSMTAEGLKQLGIIPVLIKTGHLRTNSIVFLDEPDNNLSPWAVGKFIELLMDLAKLGVQVFLSSHSYFVINRLHIEAKRYNTPNFARVFAFDKKANGLVEVETVDLSRGLPQHNPILDEAIAIFQEDTKVSLRL